MKLLETPTEQVKTTPEIRTNLRDYAYLAIKDMIKTWKLAPGDIINERSLMSVLGMGRTPVHEALNALAQERLTEVIPRKGTYVTQITLADILNLYQVREFMEPQIVSIATPLVSSEILSVFRDSFSALLDQDTDELVNMDNQFHRYLAAATGNSYIVNMMENIYFQNERLRVLATRSVATSDETRHGHLALIDAMLARDPAAATQAMREHLQYAKKVALSLNIGKIKLY